MLVFITLDILQLKKLMIIIGKIFYLIIGKIDGFI